MATIRELTRTYTWNNFENYGRAFNDRQVTESATFTAIFVVGGVLIELFLGLLLAYLFNRPMVGRGLMRAGANAEAVAVLEESLAIARELAGFVWAEMTAA